MTSDAILTELRGLRRAPDSLRERVRTLPEPQPRFTFAFPVRRVLLVAAPAVVVLALGGAALHGVLSSGPPRPVVLSGVAHGSAGTATFGAAKAPTALQPQLLRPLAPSATRLTRYAATLRLDVTRDRLAQDARLAMQLARNAGGYVASVDMNETHAALVLRIPNTKVQQAVLDLGALGTVTAQHVRIADLQRTANLQEDRIAKLRTQIAAATGAERTRLEQLLARLLKAHAQTVREGSLATVAVTFTVPQAAAAHPSRLGRTAHEAGRFLVRELSWLLFALIVFGPVALVAFVAIVGVRALRRRAEAQLLSSTQ